MLTISSDSNRQPDRVLTMAPPPSTNALWTHPGAGKPRVRTAAYRAWIESAGWQVRMQLVGAPTIVGTFDAVVTVPSSSAFDRNNHDKAIFDLLQHVGVVRNDSGLRDYAVLAEDRADLLVQLWDRGGPEQHAARPMRLGKSRPQRPTAR